MTVPAQPSLLKIGFKVPIQKLLDSSGDAKSNKCLVHNIYLGWYSYMFKENFLGNGSRLSNQWCRFSSTLDRSTTLTNMFCQLLYQSMVNIILHLCVSHSKHLLSPNILYLETHENNEWWLDCKISNPLYHIGFSLVNVCVSLES